MNIVINCPHCNQEMVIDESGVGATVPCPTCSKDFVIPQGRSEEEVKKEREAAAAAPKPEEKKEEKKPQLSKEELAALLPNQNKVAAGKKETEKPGIRVACFQHHLCIDMGKDKFAETVQKAMANVPREDIINVSPLCYTYKTSGDIFQDYGIMVTYYHRGDAAGEEKKD